MSIFLDFLQSVLVVNHLLVPHRIFCSRSRRKRCIFRMLFYGQKVFKLEIRSNILIPPHSKRTPPKTAKSSETVSRRGRCFKLRMCCGCSSWRKSWHEYDLSTGQRCKHRSAERQQGDGRKSKMRYITTGEALQKSHFSQATRVCAYIKMLLAFSRRSCR